MLFTAQTAFKFNNELEYKNHNCKGNSTPSLSKCTLVPRNYRSSIPESKSTQTLSWVTELGHWQNWVLFIPVKYCTTQYQTNTAAGILQQCMITVKALYALVRSAQLSPNCVQEYTCCFLVWQPHPFLTHAIIIIVLYCWLKKYYSWFQGSTQFS